MNFENNNSHHKHESPIKRSNSFESSILGYLFQSILGSHKNKNIHQNNNYPEYANIKPTSDTLDTQVKESTELPSLINPEEENLNKDITNPEHEANVFPDRKIPSKGTIGTILGILAILFFKFKGLIFTALKIFPAMFKLKAFLTTGLSMLFMIWVYASIYTWKFAIGFVLLIYIHEMGHALLMYLKGIKATSPIFIPFIGALIVMKDQPKDAQTEAYVGIGGPLLGSIGAILCFILYLVTNQVLFLSLAYFGFFLNLFNLTPIRPLDGGRVVAAISTKIWILGIIVLAIEAFIFMNPLLIMLLIMAVISFFSGKEERNTYNSTYYNVPLVERVIFSLGYFGLVAFLGLATFYTHELLLKLGPGF